jgi:pimeloyl-ACP methyl ester carboxylesterase
MRTTSVKERTVQFGSGARLVGIATEPAVQVEGKPAVILLNAGLLHRVGPNRMSVDLARRFAPEGLMSLRFDFSGIGDSRTRAEGLPFLESSVHETREAMDLLESTFGTRRFVLLGLCSGGTVAFLTARDDPRVEGAVLVNVSGHLHGNDPQLGTYLRHRSMRRHYFRIATSASFASKTWRKAIATHVDYAGLVRSIMAYRPRPRGPQGEVASDLRRLQERGVSLLHVYSEGDEGLDYAHVVFGGRLDRLGSAPRSRLELIAGANHTLTLRWAQNYLGDLILEWLRSWA